ncbi:HET-domain-containing protein [Colletotrichum scovillei]|uniref:HET-domain-containing protein n=1 Tax=Colletotrichum scovillei TaxID=1209932 RepID=A0A9P7QU52_9PEZI|nr:HET-domain-containing protein [Colletotrichum scovillei]KAG7041595.1 HET-domain-containing protein [Colletotrichum scovillei]KAG7061621.1 HET-domain-containing protein [Colletotrichum scovillei]
MACECCVERRGLSGGRWEDLREGIQGGCSRCAFIDQCIRLAPFGTQEVDGILVLHGDYCEVLTYNLYKDVTRVDVFTTDGQEENPLQLKQIAAHLPGSTSSETTFRTIKGWLNECTSSHKYCPKNGKQGHEQQASPKRLLKISKDQVVLWENVGQQPMPSQSVVA